MEDLRNPLGTQQFMNENWSYQSSARSHPALHGMKKVLGNFKPLNIIFKEENRAEVMLRDYCFSQEYRSDPSTPLLFQIKSELINYGSNVYSLDAVSRCIINNDRPTHLVTIEFVTRKVKINHPDTFRLRKT